MKISYIRFSKKKPEKMLMKHLRDENQNKLKHEKSYKDNFANFYGKKSNLNKAEDKKIAKHSKINNNKSTQIESLKANLKKLWQDNLLKNRNQTYRVRFNVNKNRVALVAVSLMLVTASYMNYLNRTKLKIAELGDATFVSANAIISNTKNNKTEEASNNEENTNVTQEVNAEEAKNIAIDNSSKENNDATQTESTEKNNDVNSNKEKEANKEVSSEAEIESKNYFTKLRLDREKTFSQMLDNYNAILDKGSISEEQKNVAAEGIKQINNSKNSITTIENLLKGKGFEDVVVLINENSTNVIVKSSEELNPKQVAQIENIVSRELNLDIEKIHITTHN